MAPDEAQPVAAAPANSTARQVERMGIDVPSIGQTPAARQAAPAFRSKPL
jgi:hypothetical protein